MGAQPKPFPDDDVEDLRREYLAALECYTVELRKTVRLLTAPSEVVDLQEFARQRKLETEAFERYRAIRRTYLERVGLGAAA